MISLSQAVLCTGIVLIVFGALLFRGGPSLKNSLITFGRSQVAAYITFGLGSIWFIYKVAHLSEADEIGFLSRDILLTIFVTIALLSFYYVPDFLSVRGFAVILLLLANDMLHISWMQYSTTQMAFNALVYIFIVIALVLGASPYKWRDFFTWLFKDNTRNRLLGGAFVAYGTLLLLLAGSA